MASPAPPPPRRSSFIREGERLPESTFSYIDAGGALRTITVSELTRGKRYVIINGCTTMESRVGLDVLAPQIAFIRAAGGFSVCVTREDPRFVRAGRELFNIGYDEMMILSDRNGEFARAIGRDADRAEDRYQLFIMDGIVSDSYGEP